MTINRRPTRRLVLGGVAVGDGAPVSIQSMCSTDTRDEARTLAQIRRLAAAGCDIVRVAVVDRAAVAALGRIRAQSPLPVVADIHFDYRLAIAAAEAGADGLRYNPGNIGDPRRVERLARAAADRGIPIRVGVNAGSLDRRLLDAQGRATPEALVQSALDNTALLESAGFGAIKLSLKASDVPTTLAAYRLASRRCDYPLHLGLTEAGTLVSGATRSAVALGVLLAEGIGDTVRVSLSADPVEEVWVARQILGSLGLRSGGLTVTSCPRCGRASVEVYQTAERVERALRDAVGDRRLHVAVMGCEVNGPGEARAADLGIAGAGGGWVLFRAGKKVRRLDPEEGVKALVSEALEFLERR